jgi:hypothetical protein
LKERCSVSGTIPSLDILPGVSGCPADHNTKLRQGGPDHYQIQIIVFQIQIGGGFCPGATGIVVSEYGLKS